MKRIFLIGMMLVWSLSCSHDVDDVVAPGNPNPEPSGSPYAVSVEEALSALYVALDRIDGADETRAGVPRCPLGIATVKASDVCDFTRTEMPDADDLFYVVSFGEGNGSAVLGADKRVDEIFAILDETVLSPEDFLRPETRSGDASESLSGGENLRVYLSNMIVGAAMDQIERYPVIDDSIGRTHIPTYRTSIEEECFQKPLTSTKWSQRSPFNDACPFQTGSSSLRVPAGCGPIAIAQLLAFYQYPAKNVIDGKEYAWSQINQCNNTLSPANYPENAKKVLAEYIYKLGRKMGTQYGNTGSSTLSSNMIAYLRKIGLTQATETNWSELNARNIVYTRKEPFCIIGFYGSAMNECHIWLIDGWHEYVKRTWVTYYSGLLPLPEQLAGEEWTKLSHCNFGWGGLCDGYYTHGMYDTTKTLDSKFIDSEAGDFAGIGGYNFNKTMLMYVL